MGLKDYLERQGAGRVRSIRQKRKMLARQRAVKSGKEAEKRKHDELLKHIRDKNRKLAEIAEKERRNRRL